MQKSILNIYSKLIMNKINYAKVNDFKVKM